MLNNKEVDIFIEVCKRYRPGYGHAWDCKYGIMVQQIAHSTLSKGRIDKGDLSPAAYISYLRNPSHTSNWMVAVCDIANYLDISTDKYCQILDDDPLKLLGYLPKEVDK